MADQAIAEGECAVIYEGERKPGGLILIKKDDFPFATTNTDNAREIIAALRTLDLVERCGFKVDLERQNISYDTAVFMPKEGDQ